MDPTSADTVIRRGTVRMPTLSLTAVAVLAIGVLVLTAVSDDSDAEDTGPCGTGLTWNYESATGKLTITGTGAMTDFAPIDVRWGGNEIVSVDMSGMGANSTIGRYAFSGCTSLETVTFSDQVTNIGEHAFSGCTTLEEITIGSGVTGLNDYAFMGCTSLETFTLGESMDYFDVGKVFSGCASLREIRQATAGNPLFKVQDGILYNGAMNDLLYYPLARGGEAYTIPDGVTSVNGNAFSSSTIHLKHLTIGSNVNMTEFLADCTFLESIDVHSSNHHYQSSGGVLFSYDGTQLLRFPAASSLEAYLIPDSVTSIEANAFKGCTGLRHLTFGPNLTTVDPDAFAGVGLYEPDAVTPITLAPGSMMGWEFFSVDGKLSQLLRKFSEIGSDYHVGPFSSSETFDAVNIAYLKDAASKDAAVKLTAETLEGYTAVFEAAAILSFGDEMAIFAFTKVDNSTLDAVTRALVGDDPVYSITFGGNTSFGTGKVTYTVGYTLPEGGKEEDIRVHYINAGTFAETMSHNYAMGKISFDSNHLSLYSIQLGDAPVPPTVKYTIQLKLNGGESSSVSTAKGWTLNGDTWSRSFNEGSALTIEDPSKDGYSFKGWTPSLPETVTADGVYEAGYSKSSSIGLGNGTSLWIIIGVGIVAAVGYTAYFIISKAKKKV